MSVGQINSPDAGFAPFWEGIFLVVGALSLVAMSLRQRITEPVGWPRGEARRMVIHLPLALIGYVLLIGWVGYIVSTFLFLFAAITAWRHYPWWVAGLSSGGLSLILYLVFHILLQTPLPRNSLGLP